MNMLKASLERPYIIHAISQDGHPTCQVQVDLTKQKEIILCALEHR